MIYKTSLDNFAKTITVFTTIVFIVIITGQVSLIIDFQLTVPIITIIFLVATYLVAFLYRPIDYRVTDTKLIIHRPLQDIEIERKDIQSVEKIDKAKLSFTVRTFGVGGLFGYWGRFANHKIGVMTWYGTRRDKAVLVKTFSNKKFVVTPDNLDEFLASLS